MQRAGLLRRVDALVDGPEGAVLVRDVDILVLDDRVAAIARSGAIDPGEAEVHELPGRLVLPGLVNLHAHTGTNAHHLLVDGAGETELLGATYLTTKAPRAPLPGGLDPVDEARWTAWELLRGGTTTVLDAGASADQATALASVAAEVGLRAHVGVALSSGQWRATGGALTWFEHGDDAGELDRAEAFLTGLAGAPLVAGAVTVAQADTASDELLRGAHALAERWRVPLTLHAAQNRREVLITLDRHGVTPITRLHRLGVLSPRTVLAHAVYLDHHPAVATGAAEVRLLAESGASVAHCPLHLARRGEALRSFSSYAAAGVRVGLGTDTLPRDLLAEIGTAALLDGVVSGAARPSTARAVDAATVVGADALGRRDLGRIAVGGPADVVVVDLREIGVLGDPVRAAVEHATRREVEHVFVAGRHVVRDGTVVGIDPEPLRRAAQVGSETLAATAPGWHRHGRSAADLAPPPFPEAAVDTVARALEVTR